MANIASTTASAGTDVTARALREAVFAGLISLGLFVLFVGLKSDQNIRNELILNQRWGLLAIFVIVAAVGRFLMVAYVQPAMARRKAAKAEAEGAVKEETFFTRHFSKIAIAFLILYPPIVLALCMATGSGIQGSLKWVDNFGIQILIYVMLAWGLNIVVGLAGLLDLGYVAFYAVGAYVYALLASPQFGLHLPAQRVHRRSVQQDGADARMSVGALEGHELRHGRRLPVGKSDRCPSPATQADDPARTTRPGVRRSPASEPYSGGHGENVGFRR